MIVVCTRCQAKFRVADERVGPRGAKVRCSRCQTVFLVHRDLGSVPIEAAPPGTPEPREAPPPPAPEAQPRGAFEIDLEPGRSEASTMGADFHAAPDPFGGADPFASSGAPPPSVPSLEDPFAAAAAAEAPVGHAADADPFAAVMAPPAPPPDFFGGHGMPHGGDPDPFALGPPGPEPMAPTPPPIASPTQLPVTDLSDLMGGMVEPPPPPPPEGEASDPDFALDARAAPRPRVTALEAATEAAEVNVAAAVASSRQEQSFYAGPDDAALKLATETTEPPPGLPLPSEVPTPVHGTAALAPEPMLAPPPPAPARGRVRAPEANERDAELAARTIAQKLPRLRRASRIRKILLNAAALVVLVLLATALLVLVRTRGKLEPGALRPSAVLRALGGKPLGTFAVVEVTSGAYERAKGPPLLFVRGRAVSRAAAPVRALAVNVEVVLRGEVVARGRALAGAVPTPEELYAVPDAAALAGISRAAEARAPTQVKPGEEVPFLVAIADYPRDVEGAALRLSVAEGAPGGGP
ncbi:MAG: zinc-ribbon domain-containing protein [Anaeromyxobacteraceae bacterium]